MDLRETLTRLTEENEALRRLAKRVEVTAAFAEEDLRRFRERTEVEKLVLQFRMESGLQEQREARAQQKQRRKEVLEANLRRRINAKLEVLHTISDALETCREHLADVPDLTGKSLEDRRAEIGELIEKVQNRERVIRARSAKTYQRSLRILQANPTARARKELREAMETLRSLRG
jgi:vacuolar-type H+-ATPase subunit I/STV1